MDGTHTYFFWTTTVVSLSNEPERLQLYVSLLALVMHVLVLPASRIPAVTAVLRELGFA
jgi:hypothetical protein